MASYWFSYYFDRLKREFPKQPYRILPQKSRTSAIIGAVARFFEVFETDSTEFELSLNPATAKGFWLDFWGFFFNETRFYAEDDAPYRQRIRSGIIYGKNSEEAIIEAIRPLVATTPQIIEPRGKILQNVDYSTYDYDAQYDGQAFIIILKYRPPTAEGKAWFIGKNYLGYDTYAFDSTGGKTTSIQQQRIKDIVDRTKLAGVKVVHDIT
jgi:hypothetical protein